MQHSRCYEQGFYKHQEMISRDEPQAVVPKLLASVRLFSDRRERVCCTIKVSGCNRGGCLLMVQLNSSRWDCSVAYRARARTVSVQSLPMFIQCRCNTTSWPHKDETASPPTIAIITEV
jgi:hypothetical protein